jgi:hypothetical protein
VFAAIDKGLNEWRGTTEGRSMQIVQRFFSREEGASSYIYYYSRPTRWSLNNQR